MRSLVHKKSYEILDYVFNHTIKQKSPDLYKRDIYKYWLVTEILPQPKEIAYHHIMPYYRTITALEDFDQHTQSIIRSDFKHITQFIKNHKKDILESRFNQKGYVKPLLII